VFYQALARHRASLEQARCLVEIARREHHRRQPAAGRAECQPDIAGL
jgi:hypothetical protein